MDCSKCPLRDECDNAKFEMRQKYKEMQDYLQRRLFDYCPLQHFIEQQIAKHTQYLIDDYKAYKRVIKTLKGEDEK